MVIERFPQAAPTVITADIEREVQRVKRTLQADDRQALRFAKARLACSTVENEPLLREDAMAYADLSIALSDTSLNPLTIAIIGQSGRGKSTLNCALTGRSDIQPFASGKPLTGCVTRTFTDIDPADDVEHAILQMRTESEIRALVEKQVKKGLGVDDFRMPDDIEDLPSALNALSIGIGNGEETRAALLDVVNQHIRHADIRSRRINLDSPNGREILHNLIREDSAQNSNPEQRMVDVVKWVDIHLVRDDDKHLELPDTTCLVDTFGSGGSTTHTWGLEELFYEGDIDLLIFCVNPRRVTETEYDFGRMINAAIQAGKLHRTQILMVHNAIDEAIQHGENETAIAELMHVLSGDQEMFEIHETSALAALWALEARNGNAVPNSEKYKSIAIALGIDPDVWNMDDSELHTAVYERSGLPELIQAINSVTRAYTVEVRVKAAETSVNNTVSRLSAHYDTEHARVADQLAAHGPPDVKAVKVLAERQAEAKFYIAEKRAALLDIEPELQTLFTEASDNLYTHLGEVLPKLWENSLVPDRLRTVPLPIIHRPLPRTFVSDIEEWIWNHLELAPVGHYFADRIATEFGENTYTELLHFAFDTPVAKEVMRFETVREMTRSVGNDIIDFAKNSGKAMLGKPKYRLLPSDLSNPSPVVKVLETIAKTHDADAEHFEALRDAIRESYETGIKEAVAAIHGFHDAKLAEMEHTFNDLLFETFIRLQDNREALGATLFAAADDEVHALQLQKQTLDEKRAGLKKIETFMTATDTDTDAPAS